MAGAWWSNERSPRVCVVGAGAMGGLVAARLAETGASLTLVDRAERVAALRARGLTLVSADGVPQTVRNFVATTDTAELGEQDVVFLGVKAYDIAAVAPRVPALLGRDTVVVTLQNGMPWWYFQRHGGELDGRRLHSLDPDGVIARNVDAARIIGCIPYPAAEVVEEGVVRHVEGNRLPIGELDGSVTERVRGVAALLEAAAFRSRVLEDVRSEVWLKAVGTLTFNPLSALTGATLAGICAHPETRGVAAEMMREGQEVARALGVALRRTIEERINGAAAVGAHKTSMLQDVEAGRRLELDALVGSVRELGGLTGIRTPTIDAIYACAKLLDDRLAASAHPYTEQAEC